MQGEDQKVAAALSEGKLEQSGLDPKTVALLTYVETITLRSSQATREEIEALKKVGWTEKQIIEAVYITGLFAMLNRVADAFGLEAPSFEQVGDKRPFTPAERFQ